MGEKIVVGPINKGLRTDRTPFVIDNDSFPTLINAYQWRGRIRRKRGTSFLCRLQRYFNSGLSSINLDAGGNANLLTGFATIFTFQTNGSIVPGSVTIAASAGPIYTDPGKDGILVSGILTGTINYNTGAISLPSQAGNTVGAIFLFNPNLPVMGLEDLITTFTEFPGTMAFDTVYSYIISQQFPYNAYDVSYYKNPIPSGLLPGYIPKTVWTRTTWNGFDYQQFWTTCYQGALWATNGISVPFIVTKIGMQFAPASTITYVSNTATTLTVVIANSPLVVGDFVFLNEWTAAGGAANAQTLNFQTGYVTAAAPNTPPLANKTITITFPNAAIAAVIFAPGIIQYLTNRSDPTKDCLRWFDGDPTNGSTTSPVFIQGNGWVNFAPPLSREPYSVAQTPQNIYYLVGARMILPFKDRLLFIGPVIQTSADGANPIYLQDTVIYSQNGTPYYTASFTGDPSLATTVFFPILVPTDQTATPNAYWEDQTGFGGFVSAGIDQPLMTAAPNGDVLIMGFNTLQSRLVYSGDDILPFNFFLINSELGSSSTFSSINMDRGVITRGNRGYIITSQESAERIDLNIPDQVFEIDLTNNGNERFCSQRDFINEWIYFTYPDNQIIYKFPNQTLQYNYRDNSWAIFNECYTTYGSFRKQTGFTWATVGLTYPSWQVWNVPWNAGSSTLLEPEVIAGNQQGFVIVRDDGTGEGTSLMIQNIVGSLVTSPNHQLNNGDYIIITGALGTVASQVNLQVFSVSAATTNTFLLNPAITGGTYVGGGLITRMYVPKIQTKQFPSAWDMVRKTRLGPQHYLLTTTPDAQIQLLIYLSQNSASPYNDGPIFPSPNSQNDALIYSTVLYTCPESTNLGLTPANSNLQMIVDSKSGVSAQAQIWHRINTSLIGDTIQIGFTISDAQMRALDFASTLFTITNITKANPAVLTTNAQFSPGQLIEIQNVLGMTEINNNTYIVISSTATTVFIQLDSTNFTTYISGGTAQAQGNNQFAEIEIHGFTLDINPSSLLA